MVLAIWLVTGQAATAAPLIALSVAAMGAQTAAARRFATASGITRTFVTGSLTSLLQDIADGADAHPRIRIGAVVTLVAGALSAAGTIPLQPALGPLLPALAAQAAAALFPGGQHR